MIYILIAIAIFIFLQWRSHRNLNRDPYQVVRHIDGDTTIFRDCRNNNEFRVRYLVIDANERYQAGGPEATRHLTRLLPIGSRAFIGFTGNKSHDRYEGTVYRRGKDINLEMLLAGHAVIDDRYMGRISPAMRSQYRAALKHAQTRKLGRWAMRSHQQSPQEFRSRR